jgi:cellulose synthase/poly-beta-1,6-N-acetylglucosamine synthase-like glycosyltransferase
VSDKPPSVTVIIAAKPDQAEIQAVAAARRLDYPPDRLEIIITRGKQPSAQRNVAMRAARGDWLYFLDDDSVPGPENLRRAAKFMSDPGVKMLGGPNLCPPDAPPLEQVFAVVLGSWLAFGPSRARYARVGAVRRTGEKELILCNLMARRDSLLELGGFNEALYPNEENALMDELQKQGGKLMYDPQFVVYRRPRRTLKAFARMLMTYGRGRAEQFRVYPTFGSLPNLIPLLFCVYLIVLLAVESAASGTHMALWGATPLALYGFCILLQTVASAFTGGVVRALAAMPLLAASHLLYGFGFWRGLFTKLPSSESRPHVEVRLETVAAFEAQPRSDSPPANGPGPVAPERSGGG